MSSHDTNLGAPKTIDATATGSWPKAAGATQGSYHNETHFAWHGGCAKHCSGAIKGCNTHANNCPSAPNCIVALSSPSGSVGQTGNT
eukprot:1762036-Amphidinium_carterae.1